MIRNFLFHRVNPQRDALWDPMDVEHFEKVIKYITTKYTVVRFEDIAFDQKALETKNIYATIMFDDGYKDNIEYALPILNKYEVKASFYVVTDCIDRNIPTWTYQLDYAFQCSGKKEIVLDLEFLPQKFRYNKFDSDTERQYFAKRLKPFLKTLQSDRRAEVLIRVHEQLDDINQPDLMMNWEDIKELDSDGHYIGSHTVTHPMLGTMSDRSQISRELLVSGKRIEEKLGYFPVTISYPVGSTNEVVRKISRETGYKIGLAVKQDVYNPDVDGMFDVARIELYNEPWFKTKLRISNRLEDVKKRIGYR